MNVVLDLDGVVFQWQPERLLARAFREPRSRAAAREVLRDRRHWSGPDGQAPPTDGELSDLARREGVRQPRLDRLFSRLPNSLKVRNGTLGIMRDLADKGHRLYAQSALPRWAVDRLRRDHTFWDLFEGVATASHDEAEMPRQGLLPGETLVINDVDTHVEAAERLGYRTIRFRDPQQCRAQLEKRGCL